MNKAFFDELRQLEKEKKIPLSHLAEKIKNALAIAVKRDYGTAEDCVVEIDPETEKFYIAIRKVAVKNVEKPLNEILIQDAFKYSSNVSEGELIEIPLDTKDFGRIAAQAAKHVIRQGIREAERSQLLEKYQDKKFEIVSAKILKIDNRKGNVTLEIDNSEAILPKSEQIPGEVLRESERISVYVVDVQNGEKGPKLMISRTHPGLVKRLFELETPELRDGTVEIRAISREAGSRTKIAVKSNDENVDPIGSCIGPKGARVSAIVNELGGEKIDVIKYSDDPESFIASALSPASVLAVEIDPDTPKCCHVTVPDNQLSLAIGNKGQNARLAARLTGWKIDIKPESGFIEIN